MASGCCSQGATCSCIIRSDDDRVLIVGAGTDASPILISLQGLDWFDSFTVLDTSTVNLTVTGGTGGNPLVLRADATIDLEDITNLNTAGATLGDVISYDGTGWVAQPAPVSPPGAVNVSDGLIGTGALADPIEVAVSGTWGVAPLNTYGTDSTVGLAVYIDSAGQVRAEPRPTAWSSITGKPSVFPTNAANVANQLSLNVGYIRGKQVFTDPTDTTGANAPTTGVSDGDVYFYRQP